MAEKINVNEFKPGISFLKNNEVYQVIESSHSKSGRGQAHVKCKVKNLFTGATSIITFTGGERIEKAFISKKEMQFLYLSGDDANFMDNETFEQISIPKSHLVNELKYMTEGLTVSVMSYETKILGVELPKNVNIIVEFAADAVRGDTVTAATKKITLVTGLEIDVPQFIETGQKIIVSTQTGKYNGKV
ncbi:MAG: elongation factor P [Mycoplasmataceae bacterium]|nr:elongation factor P [Mycoplasmataceae bacterium]